MLLLDKGYYDYDYSKVDKPAPAVNWESTIKTDEEVADLLSIFGMGPMAKKRHNLEELQQYIIKEESKNE